MLKRYIKNSTNNIQQLLTFKPSFQEENTACLRKKAGPEKYRQIWCYIKIYYE